MDKPLSIILMRIKLVTAERMDRAVSEDCAERYGSQIRHLWTEKSCNGQILLPAGISQIQLPVSACLISGNSKLLCPEFSRSSSPEYIQEKNVSKRRQLSWRLKSRLPGRLHQLIGDGSHAGGAGGGTIFSI